MFLFSIHSNGLLISRHEVIVIDTNCSEDKLIMKGGIFWKQEIHQINKHGRLGFIKIVYYL